jgi:hypothetical protein
MDFDQMLYGGCTLMAVRWILFYSYKPNMTPTFYEAQVKYLKLLLKNDLSYENYYVL